jgi:hypothetical protein
MTGSMGANGSPSYQFPQGWRRRLPPGVYLESELLASRAFQELPTLPSIKVLLRFLQKRHIKKDKGGKPVIVNNGRITFPYSEADEMGIGKRTFTRALDVLIGLGFVDVTVSGKGRHKQATRYFISDRWMKYGTDQFVEKRRPKQRHGPDVPREDGRFAHGKS